MKIAVIGNSHAGPIYTAWKKYRKGGGQLDASFFIERSAGTEPLILSSSDGVITEFPDIKILPDPVLKVADFDAFVVVGLGVGFHPVASTYRRVRSDHHSLKDDCFLVSDSCFEQTVKDLLYQTKAVRVAQALEVATDVPIALIPQPHSAEWIREYHDESGQLYREIEKNRDALTLLRDYERALCDMGNRIEVLPAPSETVTNSIYTLTDYTLGNPDDVTAGSAYSRGDFYHGNLAWGSVIIGLIHDYFGQN